MLLVIHGTDTTTVADKTSKLVSGLLQKRPDAQVFTFEGGEITEGDIDTLIGAQGLFVEKHIIVLKQTLEDTVARDVVLERVKKFAESQNVIVISENGIIAADKKKLTKHAKQVEEYKKVKKDDRGFNVFSLGDALGKKDKRGLWTGYIQALRAGLEVQAIHGTIHWAVKALLAAKGARSAEEAGQKPYTYNNYSRYASAYSVEELCTLSRELVALYHDEKRGKLELKIALERWILNI